MTLRPRSFILAVLIVIGVVALDSTASWAGPGLSWINSTRASRGLAPLAASGGLDGLAASHTRAMISRNGLFHTSGLGSAVGSVYPNWTRVGENVGVGSSLAAVQSMFMNSAEHRSNILGGYNVAGTAAITGPDGRVWVTQTFAYVPGLSGGAAPVASGTTRVPAPSTSTATRTATARASRSFSTGGRRLASPATRAVQIGQGQAPPSVDAIAGAAMSSPHGYWLAGSDGGVFAFGEAPFFGALAGKPLAAPIVGMQASPTGLGYLLAASDGGVFAFGDAAFHGSVSQAKLNEPIIGVASLASGRGYRLVSTDGGVFALGEATFHGSLAGKPLSAPVVGMAATPTGLGYWLVGADGGVFAFGDAAYLGGLGGKAINAPISSITASPTGLGYWLVGSDGGVFAFGDAVFYGVPAHVAKPTVALVTTPGANGYWLAGTDAGVFAFGDATFEGGLAGQALNAFVAAR